MTEGVATIGQPFHTGLDAYLSRGWSQPFVLKPGTKSPPPKGVTGYNGVGPTPAQLTEWRIKRPNGNIALRLPLGVIGFDVDNYTKEVTDKDGKTKLVEKTGAAHINELEDRLGALPPTWHSTSRPDPVSGIYLYQLPATIDELPTELAPSIEIIRRAHRYVVAWPSVHPDTGLSYRWVDANGADSVPPILSELPELPDRWVEFLLSMPVTSSDHGRAAVLTPESARSWKAAFLPDGKGCRAVVGTLKRFVDPLSGKGDNAGGSRYEMALRGSLALLELAREGHLGVKSALLRLKTAYLSAIDGESHRDPTEWQRMVVEGIAKVAASCEKTPAGGWVTQFHPEGKCPDRVKKRTVVKFDHISGDAQSSSKAPKLFDNVPGGADVVPPTLALLMTDVYAAGKLVELNKDRILFRSDVLEWMVWKDRFWTEDNGYEMRIVGRQTAEQMLKDAQDNEDIEDDFKLKLVNLSSKWLNLNRIRSMVETAQTDRSVAVRSTELDPHDFLFNLEQGTLELSTTGVKLREHRPEDRITRVCATKYAPDATHEEWTDFISMVTEGNHELERFLQRAAFASMVGTTRDKCFLNVFDGNVGNTGKTAFLETLKTVLGDGYVGYANATAFVAARPGMSAGIRADLALLGGKRMVISSEIPLGARLDTDLMKKLTAGEGSYVYEAKYKNPWEGPINFTIWLDGNGTPKVNVEDSPLFNRWKLIPFMHVIPESKRRNGWSTEMCKDERFRSSVLAWIIAGGYPDVRQPDSSARAQLDTANGGRSELADGWVADGGWWRDGIGSCQVVEDAQAMIKEQMDPLDECWQDCEVEFTDNPMHVVSKTEMTLLIHGWWQENSPGTHAPSAKMIGTILKSKGVTDVPHPERLRGRDVKVRLWHGVKLNGVRIKA